MTQGVVGGSPGTASGGPILGSPVVVDDGVTVGDGVEVGRVRTGTPVRLELREGGAGLWVGQGPPGPDNPIIGAKVGDEYLDELTGDIYHLDEG